MTDRRVPASVLVTLAGSTAGYAVLLAGIAALQSGSESELAAARAPAVDAVHAVQAEHDELLDRLEAARLGYAETSRAVLASGDALARLDRDLAAFAGQVGDLSGVAQQLPTSITLPPVRSSVSAVRAPSTQATTGASGG